MSGPQNWRIATNMDTYLRQQEKRVMHESRRPQISQASDLLGPGAGPLAIQEWDWNSDAATFVGVYFSNPADGQVNSPDNSFAWLGETFGTPDGIGFQRLTAIQTAPPENVPIVYTRKFFGTPRIYLPWRKDAVTQYGTVSFAPQTINVGVGVGSGTISFPVPFGAPPVVTASLTAAPGGSQNLVARAIAANSTDFQVWIYNTGGTAATFASAVTVGWHAVR